MPGELERLLVRIEADTTLLRREMAKADQAVGGFAATTERQLSRLEKKSDAFVAQIGRSLLRFGALFGTAQLGFKAFDVLSTASDLNDLARNTALTVEQFQELSFAIERAGGSQEALTKGAVRFARNMVELRTNMGGFNAFLKESLPSLHAQLAATKSQGEAIDVLSNALSRLSSEEDKTLLAIKAFGKGGEDLVEVLGQGSSELAKFADEARKLGVIIDEASVDALEETADAIREIGETLAGGLVQGVGQALVAWKELKDELGDSWWLSSAAGLLADVLKLESSPGARGLSSALANYGQDATSNPLKLNRKPDEIDNSGRDALASLRREMLSSTGREREVIYAEMDAELQKFRDMLGEKKISATEFEQARADLAAIASAKIGKSITEENAKYREQFREIEALLNSTFDDALTQALNGGKVAWKELASSMFADLAKLAIRAAALKPLMDAIFGAGGGASSLLGGLGLSYGGARATGGPVSSSKSYLVGERGPELFTPGSSGRITPNGAGGGVTNVFNYTIDAKGADIGVAERIEAALGMAQNRQRDPVAAVSAQNRRFPTRRV